MPRNDQRAALEFPEPSGGAAAGSSSSAWKRFSRLPSAWCGAAIVGAMVLAAALGPALSPYYPASASRLGPEVLKRPGALGETPKGEAVRHWLGTDQLGRDIWARLLAGARVSLAVGVCASLGAGIFGVLLGAWAGWLGGWADSLAMRAADMTLAFPRLILAIALLAVAPRPSLWLLVAVLAATGWAGVARLARAQVLQAKEFEYVLAARAAGASDVRLLFRHVLPSAWGLLAVWLALAVPGAIMAEAGLSFLGLGVEPGQASWGSMISEAGAHDLAAYWWMGLFPGAALAFSVLGWNLLGEALQEALNPRLDRR